MDSIKIYQHMSCFYFEKMCRTNNSKEKELYAKSALKWLNLEGKHVHERKEIKCQPQ